MTWNLDFHNNYMISGNDKWFSYNVLRLAIVESKLVQDNVQKAVMVYKIPVMTQTLIVDVRIETEILKKVRTNQSFFSSISTFCLFSKYPCKEYNNVSYLNLHSHSLKNWVWINYNWHLHEVKKKIHISSVVQLLLYIIAGHYFWIQKIR